MQLNPLQQATSMSEPLSSSYNSNLYYGYSTNGAPQEQLPGSLELSTLNSVTPSDPSIYTTNIDLPTTATSQVIHDEPATNNPMKSNAITRKIQFEGNKPFIRSLVHFQFYPWESSHASWTRRNVINDCIVFVYTKRIKISNCFIISCVWRRKGNNQ